MQSQDWLHTLETGTQSQDSGNVQHNLKIAQILRLHRTYILPKGNQTRYNATPITLTPFPTMPCGIATCDIYILCLLFGIQS